MDRGVVREVAEALASSPGGAAFTGAGVSVESGIPDFRSAAGIWARYDPLEYATIEAFHRDPDRVWGFLRELAALLEGAQPNPAHLGLARLEDLGVIEGVVTQNIDGLHQAAGSRRVVEVHGSGRRLVCLRCGYDRPSASRGLPDRGAPRCPACGGPLKPDAILFGEALPARAMADAERLAAKAPVLLVVGTSAEVYPAALVPEVTHERGGLVVEVNPYETSLSRRLPTTALRGPAGEVIPALVREVERIRGE